MAVEPLSDLRAHVFGSNTEVSKCGNIETEDFQLQKPTHYFMQYTERRRGHQKTSSLFFHSLSFSKQETYQFHKATVKNTEVPCVRIVSRIIYSGSRYEPRDDTNAIEGRTRFSRNFRPVRNPRIDRDSCQKGLFLFPSPAPSRRGSFVERGTRRDFSPSNRATSVSRFEDRWPTGETIRGAPWYAAGEIIHPSSARLIRPRRRAAYRLGNLSGLGKTEASRYVPSIRNESAGHFYREHEPRGPPVYAEDIVDSPLVSTARFEFEADHLEVPYS